MWSDTRLLDLLEIDQPIIQAPMAGSSGREMALGVSAAGGLGSLACAALGVDDLRDQLSAARDATNKALNVNFFAHAPPGDDAERSAVWLSKLTPYYKELGVSPPSSLSSGRIQPFDAVRCTVVEEFSPSVVSFHFGLPAAPLVARIKRAGCKILSTATSVAEAQWLAQHGCDAVIAQGYEAGGHRGMFLNDSLASQMGTLSLVPQVADAIDVPVVAAGGIADGRGIAAAFTLGASGVQIGTAFLFTDEATISQAYRLALEDASGHETVLSNIVSGRPARVLTNRVVSEQGPTSEDAPAFPTGLSALGPLRSAAEALGRSDFSARYCGQSAALGRKTTAFALTRDLALDGARLLER